jgi:ssDNA-binding Zn-finger/Zn-ribbon topoisomerase 1
MKISKNHTCPECSHEFDLTITLGNPMFFDPEECPECNHEIEQEECPECNMDRDEWECER